MEKKIVVHLKNIIVSTMIVINEVINEVKRIVVFLFIKCKNENIILTLISMIASYG